MVALDAVWQYSTADYLVENGTINGTGFVVEKLTL
jgi:hypothetical protein